MFPVPVAPPFVADILQSLEPVLAWLRVIDYWLSFLDPIPPYVFVAAIFVMPFILMWVLNHPRVWVRRR